MKIDLTKDNKLIMNSLGVATGKETRESIIATEINDEVISLAKISQETKQTFENNCMVYSQTTKIVVVQLPYHRALEKQ